MLRGPTYIFEEEVQLSVILGVDRGLEERQEDVLQHLPKIWQQFLRPKYVTGGSDRHTYKVEPTALQPMEVNLPGQKPSPVSW